MDSRPRRTLLRRFLAAALLLGAWTTPAGSATVRVAVAASFRPVLAALAEDHAKATGDELTVSIGSTGMLHAQIVAGAPFDVFLAADAERPERLDAARLIVPGSRTTYALGRLVLWAPGRRVAGPAVIAATAPGRVAIADPALAPFGRAAVEVLRGLGIADAVSDRIVRGHSVGQAYQFVASGAAAVGFVASSQVSGVERTEWWPVPVSLHAPIDQQAVLLRDTPAARRFAAFLASPVARATIEAAGFGVPEP